MMNSKKYESVFEEKAYKSSSDVKRYSPSELNMFHLHILNEKNISWNAKSLWIYLMSLDNSKKTISLSLLKKMVNHRFKRIQKYLYELKKEGYAVVKKMQGPDEIWEAVENGKKTL